MVFKFAAEFLHDADGGHCGGVAQGTEGAAQHIFGKLADQVDIFGAAKAGVEAFLVGEALMRHKDIAAATRTLLTGM